MISRFHNPILFTYDLRKVGQDKNDSTGRLAIVERFFCYSGLEKIISGQRRRFCRTDLQCFSDLVTPYAILGGSLFNS